MTVVAVIRRLHFRTISVAAVWPRIATLFVEPALFIVMALALFAGRANAWVFVFIEYLVLDRKRGGYPGSCLEVWPRWGLP